MPTYEYECINKHRLELTFPSWNAMREGELMVAEFSDADLIKIGGIPGSDEFRKQFICQQCGALLVRQVTAPIGFKGL